MIRKSMLAALFCLTAAAAIPLFAGAPGGFSTARGGPSAPSVPAAPTVTVAPQMPDGLLSAATLKNYADELHSAFPAQVDVFLAGKDFDYGKPNLLDVHVVGCAQVAGVLHYVVRMPNGTESFIPQSQIAVIHNRKN